MKRLLPVLFFIAATAPTHGFAQSTASQETTIPGGVLVLITYFVFVAMMMGYMALLSFRQRRLDRDIVGLEKRLDELAELQ